MSSLIGIPLNTFLGPLLFCQPSFLTRSSALKWVYRISILVSLCPVIVATSTGFKPFSNSLDVASWRKSWKCRFSIPILLHKRKKAPDKPLGVYVKRGHSWSGITPPDTPWEVLSCPLRDVNASLERGNSSRFIGLCRGNKKDWFVEINVTLFNR